MGPEKLLTPICSGPRSSLSKMVEFAVTKTKKCSYKISAGLIYLRPKLMRQYQLEKIDLTQSQNILVSLIFRTKACFSRVKTLLAVVMEVVTG